MLIMLKNIVVMVSLFFIPAFSYAAGLTPGTNSDMGCTTANQVVMYNGKTTVEGNDGTDWTCTSAPLTYYNTAGTATLNGHTVVGTATLSLGSVTVNFSGSAAFTQASSYVCTGNDTGGSALAVSAVNQSGSTVKFFGTLGDTISFTCTGN